MPRAAATKPHLSFIKGYITEVSPLSTPEDIAYAIDNMVVNRDGSVKRRLGLDYEVGKSLTPANEITDDDSSRAAIPVMEWTNVRNEGEKSYYVVQFGGYLYVFRAYESTVSTNLVASIDYSTFVTTGNFFNAKISPFWGQSVQGKFILTQKYCDPFYLEEDSSGAISANTISVEIRDYKKLDDGLADTDRSSINNTRRYNLQNSGWSNSFDVWDNEGGSSYTTNSPANTIDYTYASKGVYPCLTDTFSFFVQSSPSSNTVNDCFNPFIIGRKFLSTGVSPRGHYILDLFDQDRPSASGISAVERTVEDQVRFRLSVYYQGRVFYAGVDSNVIEQGLYFSQTLDDFDKVGRCYSINDPTDPFISDAVDTDGGFIPLPEAGKINYLGVSNNKLVIGAERGIWVVSGGDSVFTPTRYIIDKISSANFLAAYSAVEINSIIYFFGYNAIYSVGPNDFGNLVVNNLSIATVQTHYDGISQNAKEHCTGVHDRVNNILWWFYSSTTDGVSGRYYYDSALVYDLNMQAFYKHSFGALASDTPYVAGAVPTSTLGVSTAQYDVVVNGNNLVSGTDEVIASIATPTSGAATPSLKLLTVVPGATTGYKNITFSELSSRTFKDWYSADLTGVTYSSYAETWFENLGDFGRDKQAVQLQTMFQVTEDGFEDDGAGNIILSNQSGCKLTAKWDYSTSSTANRWSVVDDIYRFNDLYVAADVNDPFDYGYLVQQNKISVRGRGKVLQYRFESIDGKDLHLLGWTTEYAINSRA